MAIDAYAIDEKTLQSMVQAIVREADPAQIILFGSRSRRDYRPDSDIDLLVVERAPFGGNRSRRKEAARIWKALAGFRFPKDILVFSQSEMEQWRDSRNHVAAHALREGRILYEKS